MNKGDLICDKAHTVVGVIGEICKARATIIVLWNKVPEYQGCKTVVLHMDYIERLPVGTKVIKRYKYANDTVLTYKYYNSESSEIVGKEGAVKVWNVDGTITLEFEFIDDVSTKNNKQYTCLDIEPWDLIFDVTKDKKGFEKLYTEMILYQTIEYAMDKNKTRLNKIEKYLLELIDEVSTQEI